MDWSSLAQSGAPSLSSKSTYAGSYGQNANHGGFTTAASAPPPTQRQQHLPSLETAILDYEEHMLQSLLTEVEEKSRKSTMQMIQESVQKDWNRQRDQWLHELTGMNHESEAPSQLLRIGSNRRDNSSLLLTNSTTTNQQHQVRSMIDSNRLETDLVQKHFAIVHDSHFEQAQSWEIIGKFTNLAKELEMMEYATTWTIVSNIAGPMSPTQRAQRTAKSLGERFREGMVNRLPQTARVGDMKTMAIEFQSTFVLGDASVWPAVYFCLRCGDAVAAKRVLDEKRAVVPAVSSLLNTLATFQGSGASIWEQTAEFPFLDGHQIVEVKDLLETLKGNTDYNKYEFGVYGLLSGEKPFLSDTVEGFKTTQDYSYASIINILLHSEDTNEGITKLTEDIKALGSSHFKQASAWDFFLPLLAAQQYQFALEWLLRIAPVQATHIALGFFKANIAIQNHGDPDTSNEVLTLILTKYASNMEIPEMALKYLTLVTDKYRAHSEMAKIVVAQQDLFATAGKVELQGGRMGGTLSQIVTSREEVTAVLLEAASLFRSYGNDQNMVLCLFLAECYDQMMRALNSFLAPPERPSQDRAFWINQAKEFLKAYIDPSSSSVVQRLAAGSDLIIIEETRILLAMNDLFATKPTRLPQILEDLLPHSNEDFNHQVDRCRSFSKSLQAAYGPLISLRIELLQYQHEMIKREQNSSSAVHADIGRNKMFSDLLIRFTTNINISSSYRHSIRERGMLII